MKTLLLAAALLCSATAARADTMPSAIEKGVTATTKFCEAWVDYNTKMVELDCDGKTVISAEYDNNSSLEFNLTVSLVAGKGLKVVSCAYSNPDRNAGATELCYLARQ